MKKSRFRFSKSAVCAVVMALGIFLALSTAWATSQADLDKNALNVDPPIESGTNTSVVNALGDAVGRAHEMDWDSLLA